VLVHLQNHDVNDAVVAPAPVAEIQVGRKSIAGRFTWLSSYHSDFKYDFYVLLLPEEIAAARVTAWNVSRATTCTSPATRANLT
jgi:predicted dithiol-disulfide oxidoreductase (DUF899 family)